MALYSLFVACEGVGHFSTQARADTPPNAIRAFLRGSALREFLAKAQGWPGDFSEKDIFVFIPMDGLTNMYLCQLGRAGKYISITLARTVSRPEPNPSPQGTRDEAARP
jgi:hypothetical protein